jgi:hypothetical protein
MPCPLIASQTAPLAQRCYEQARSVEPTAVAVWEAMAATASALPGPGAARDALDAAEHAVGLGGGPESWAAFAAGALRAGRAAAGAGAGGAGAALAAAAKSAAAAPLLLAAHNTYGLAAEAAGSPGDAAAAFRRALALLQLQRGAGGGDGGGGGGAGGSSAPYTFHLTDDAGGAAAAPAGGAALEAALQLNLARALTRSGAHSEAVAAYRALEAAGQLERQPYAWICRAFAAAGAGDGAAAVGAALQAALREAAGAGTEAQYHAVLASLQVCAWGRMRALGLLWVLTASSFPQVRNKP